MDSDGRQSHFPLTRRDQVRALISPVRQEIVDAVEAGGPATIAQIAAWLGRRADTLYYHVSALVKVGVLLETGKQRAGRRMAVVYDVPGRPLRIERRAKTPAQAEDVLAVVRALMRLGDRDFRRALKSGAGKLEGPERNLASGRIKGWIAPADVPRVLELVGEIGGLLRQGKAEGAEAHMFTYVFAPAARAGRGSKPRRKAESKGGEGERLNRKEKRR